MSDGGPPEAAGSFIEHALGAELHHRPPPTTPRLLAAVAGSLFATGVLLLGASRFLENGGRSVGVLASLVLLAAAYGVIATRAGGPDLAPAAVAAIAYSIGGTALYLGIDPGIGDGDQGGVTLSLVLATAGWTAASAARWTRLRPIFVGLALIGIWALLLDRVLDDDLDSIEGAGVLSLFVGIAYLVVVLVLDRRNWHGVLATPFVVAGDVAFIAGVGALSGTLDLGGSGTSVLVIAASVTLIFIGTQGGGRRFTAWLGGAGLGTGVVELVGSWLESEESSVVIGVVVAAFGGLLIGGVYWWTNWRPAGGPAPRREDDASPSRMASAGWYPDPSGRHELRWFDGGAWTDHVRSGGALMLDAVG